MGVMEIIRARRSTRKYRNREIEEDKLARVMEAGRLAPSAKNRQEWKFVVVRDRELRAKLAAAARRQAFLAEAPVVIVACSTESNYIMSGGQYAYPIDLAIAVDHMSLQAVEEGLGSCWIGAFDEREVKQILGIPEAVRVVVLLPVGYPDVTPSSAVRKRREEIFVFDKWPGKPGGENTHEKRKF